MALLKATLIALSLASTAALRFSNVFGSHQVLQRNQPLPVWGWGASGPVTGVWGSEKQSTTADATGFWKLTFTARAASSAPSSIIVVSGGDTAALEDVLVGDVVFCSGQSNMEFTTNDVVNATDELSRANNYPLIRVTSGPLQGKLHLNSIPPGPSAERLAVDLPWAIANASTIGGVGGGGGWDFFSALCWLSLRDTFDANVAAGDTVPLGGVVECYGGTSIQYWSSGDALAACPLAATNPGSACCGYGGRDSCLFNAQVAPYTIGPTRFAAALWMQGEQNANCGGPAQIPFYACALPALIADWRLKFASPALPFGVFLLAAWKATDPAFPLLRLLQVGTASSVPAVFTASTLDAGEPKDGPVHSPYKQLPAARAALALQALLYGRAATWRGPRAASARAAALTAMVDFDPATGPLALNWAGAACPPAVGNASCESFAVLTSDCAWRSVEDAGSGAALTASLASPNALALTLQGGAAGLTIVAVRGFFANWPLVALRNAAGLPADPFLLNVTAHDCPFPHAAAWVDTGLHA